MRSICPVCNGLEEWKQACPQCGQMLADLGRLSDYYGPYSAYRPIDEMKMTDGLPDLEPHLCVHAAYCETCGRNFEMALEEWRIPD